MNHSDQHIQTVSSGDQGGPPTHRTMPLSVDATLQYSPLSSIAPFGPGALLPPGLTWMSFYSRQSKVAVKVC